eukprot:g3726.t1
MLVYAGPDLTLITRRPKGLQFNKSRQCHPVINLGFKERSGFSNRNKRSFITHGFLSNLFSKRSTVIKAPDADEAEDISEYERLENEEDIVLMEITRSDGSVATFIYRNGGMIDVSAANDLCMKVNWPSRSVDNFASALKNSYLVSSIHLRVDGKIKTNQLIAMGRATSDHAFNATLWDIIVDPEYQDKGLGKCLVERMVRTLLRREITNISIFADKQVVKFFQKVGFEADPDGIKGMFWYPPGFSL